MRHLFIITGGGKWGQSVGDSGLGERLRLALPGVAGGRFQLGKRSRTPKDTVPPCWQPGDAFRTSDFSFPCRNMGGKKKIFLVRLNPSRRCGELEPRCGDNHFVLAFSKAFLQNQLDLLFLSSFILKLTRCFPCSGVPKQRFGGCGAPQTPSDVAVIAPFGAGARQRGRSGCGNINPLGRGSQLRCEGAL